MNRYALLGLLVFALGCDSLSSGQRPKSKEKSAEFKTLREWITWENAQKTPCSKDKYGMGGGTNGFEAWNFSCENGFVVYKDATAKMREREAKDDAHKSLLAKALVSRCLTAKELAEVTDMGYDIYTRNMQPFYENELTAKFHAALLTQQLLQIHCTAKEKPTE